MRALLVHPEFPSSYWSLRFSLRIAGRKSLLPPLGLLTVASMLPRSWSVRLADLNLEPLRRADLEWADVALVTGMLVQRASLRDVLARCREAGVRTVVGGPYASALPGELGLADHVVAGEAERLVPELVRDLEAGCARPLYREADWPDLSLTPTPRFDLLDVSAYHHMAVQFSRGCPFACEFCDITALYGRRPRTKSAAQILSELEAVRATGFQGDVFFVDDNFIGNKKAVRDLLPEIAAWRRRTRSPLEFYTEASVNLADDEDLVASMTEAGFTAVFVGIETPSSESLREAGKLQNLRRDLVSGVHSLLDRGLDVWGGFIVGFDHDGPDIFDRMIRFVEHAAIPYAMVGMLVALPHTPLYRRLEREGRIRPGQPGDQFGVTNVATRLPERELLAGYRRVLEALYEPAAYFRRCRANLARWRPVPGSVRPLTRADLGAAWRALWSQGVASDYRRAYWRFLRWVLRHQPRKLRRAIAQAAAGHHYITYTRQVVLPELLRRAAAATV